MCTVPSRLDRADMPELPEVETTVRGLAPVLRGAAARLASRRGAPDLRRAFPPDLRQRLTGATRHRPRPPRQIRPDRHRPRRHPGLPSRHVGPLADRPGRARRPRPFPARDRRGAAARAQRSAPLRLARPRADRSARTDASRSPTMGPEPLGAGLRRRLSARGAGRPLGADQGAAARPADRRRPRQHLRLRGAAHGRDRALARRRPNLAARGSSGWSRRSRRCCSPRSRRAARRCAIMPGPSASSAISRSSGGSTAGKGRRAIAAAPIRRRTDSGRSTFFCPRCQRA